MHQSRGAFQSVSSSLAAQHLAVTTHTCAWESSKGERTECFILTFIYRAPAVQTELSHSPPQCNHCSIWRLFTSFDFDEGTQGHFFVTKAIWISSLFLFQGLKVLEPFKETFNIICSGFSKGVTLYPRVSMAVSLQNNSISQFALDFFYVPCFSPFNQGLC